MVRTHTLQTDGGEIPNSVRLTNVQIGCYFSVRQIDYLLIATKR